MLRRAGNNAGHRHQATLEPFLEVITGRTA
jgi:hypothetical protein